MKKTKLTLFVLIALIYSTLSMAQVSVVQIQKISSISGNLGLTLPAAETFGWHIASIGDVDGDGVPDLAVAASGDADGSTRGGAVYILFMKTNGQVKSTQKISKSSGNLGISLGSSESFGISIAALGDLDGDGVPDISVGAPDHLGPYIGGVYILFLNKDGTVKAHTTIDKNTTNFNSAASNHFGFDQTCPGDIDGDGVADLVVSSPIENDGGTQRGAVYVIFLKKDGTVKGYQKISNNSGNFSATMADNFNFGYSVTKMGDMNKDGVPDIAVSAVNNTKQAEVFVINLNKDGTVKKYVQIDNSKNPLKGVISNSELFGSALFQANDLDGDGNKELIVGADYNNDGGTLRGAFYILYLDSSQNVKSYTKISSSTNSSLSGSLYDGGCFGVGITGIDFKNGASQTLVVGELNDNDGNAKAGAIFVMTLHAHTSEVTPINPDNIQESVSVFPNPGKNIFNLSFSKPNSEKAIEVLDMNGKTILKATYGIGKSIGTIDLDTYPVGIYLLRVKDNDKVSVLKICKN